MWYFMSNSDSSPQKHFPCGSSEQEEMDVTAISTKLMTKGF